MWEPVGTHGSALDLLAQQAATIAKLGELNLRVTSLVADVDKLNAVVVDIQRQLDGTDPR